MLHIVACFFISKHRFILSVYVFITFTLSFLCIFFIKHQEIEKNTNIICSQIKCENQLSDFVQLLQIVVVVCIKNTKTMATCSSITLFLFIPFSVFLLCEKPYCGYGCDELVQGSEYLQCHFLQVLELECQPLKFVIRTYIIIQIQCIIFRVSSLKKKFFFAVIMLIIFFPVIVVLVSKFVQTGKSIQERLYKNHYIYNYHDPCRIKRDFSY